MENKGNIPHFPMKSMVYPLVMTNIAIEAMSIEIVDLPIDSMVDLSIVFCMFTRPGLGIFDACWG